MNRRTFIKSSALFVPFVPAIVHAATTQQIAAMITKPVRPVSSISSIMVDALVDMEYGSQDDTVDSIHFQSSSHGTPSANSWPIYGSGNATVDSIGQHSIGTKYSAAGVLYDDLSGRFGWKFATSSSYLYAIFQIPLVNTVSCGAWFRYNSPNNYTNYDLLEIGGQSGSFSIGSCVDSNKNFYVEGSGGGSEAGNIINPFNQDTWYWVSVYYSINQPASAALYSSSGTLLGISTTPHSIGADQAKYVYFGMRNSRTANVYCNLVAIDWTNARYPLGP